MPVIARDSFAAGNLVYAWPFPIGPECEVACGDDEQVVMCPAWTVGDRLGPGRHRWRSPDPTRPVAAYFVSFGAVDVEFDMVTQFSLPATRQPIWIRASGSVLVRCADAGMLVAQFIGLPFDSLDEGIRRSVARSVERMIARLLTRRVVLAGTINAITEPSLLPEIVAEIVSYNPTAGAVFGIELSQVSRLYIEANDGAVTKSSPPAQRQEPAIAAYGSQPPAAPAYAPPMFHHGEAPQAPAYAVPTSQPPSAAASPRAEYSDPLAPVAASEPSIIIDGADGMDGMGAMGETMRWGAQPPPSAAPNPSPVPEAVARHDTLRGIAAISPSVAAAHLPPGAAVADARAATVVTSESSGVVSGETKPPRAATPPPIPPQARRSPSADTLPPPVPAAPAAPAAPRAPSPPSPPAAAEGSNPKNARLASEPSEPRGSILAIGARIGERDVTSGEILAKVAPGKRVLVPGPHGLMQSATVRQLLSGYYELEVGSSGETIWVPMAHVVPE